MSAAFTSGRAAEIFGAMVSGLGGPSDFVEKHDNYLKTPPIIEDVFAASEARKFASNLSFNTRQIGLAVIELGGGRTRPQDDIDHAVGITNICGRDWNGSDPICRIHARDQESFDKAKNRVLAAMGKGNKTPKAILERIEA